MRIIKVFLVGATIALSATTVIAATVSVTGTCGGFSETKTGPGDVFQTASGVSSGCGGNGRAIVGSGYVGAYAQVATLTTSPENGSTRATANVTYALTISTPSSYTGGEIDVQVLFGFDGSVGGATDTNATNDSLRQARIDATYQINGFSTSGSGSDMGTVRREFLADEYDTSTGSSFAFAGSGAPPIASRVLSIVPAGGLSVSFTLIALANMNSTNNQVSVTANAFDTFGFASGGPSFILPDGFFVNSTEASIINNHWSDPRPVPLPASLPMLLVGGLIFRLVGRSRKSSKLSN